MKIIMDKKVFRTILSVVLSLILALSVYVAVLMVQISLGWLNPNVVRDAIKGSGYAFNASKEMRENLINLFEAEGLDTEIISVLCDDDENYLTLYQDVDNILSGKENDSLWKEDFQEKVSEAIRCDFKSKGIIVDGDIEKSIELVSIEAGKIYDSYLHPDFLVRFHELSEGFKTVGIMVLAGSIVLALLVSYVLLSLFKMRYHATEYIGMGLLVAGVLNIMVTLYLLNSSWIERSGIGPAAYAELVKTVSHKSAMLGFFSTAFYVLVVIVVVDVTRYARKTAR